jgi:hypothetical protein
MTNAPKNLEWTLPLALVELPMAREHTKDMDDDKGEELSSTRWSGIRYICHLR